MEIPSVPPPSPFIIIPELSNQDIGRMALDEKKTALKVYHSFPCEYESQNAMRNIHSLSNSMGLPTPMRVSQFLRRCSNLDGWLPYPFIWPPSPPPVPDESATNMEEPSAPVSEPVNIKNEVMDDVETSPLVEVGGEVEEQTGEERGNGNNSDDSAALNPPIVSEPTLDHILLKGLHPDIGDSMTRLLSNEDIDRMEGSEVMDDVEPPRSNETSPLVEVGEEVEEQTGEETGTGKENNQDEVMDHVEPPCSNETGPLVEVGGEIEEQAGEETGEENNPDETASPTYSEDEEIESDRMLLVRLHPVLGERMLMHRLLSNEDIDRMESAERRHLHYALDVIPKGLRTDISTRNLVSLSNSLNVHLSRQVRDYISHPKNRKLHPGWTPYPLQKPVLLKPVVVEEVVARKKRKWPPRVPRPVYQPRSANEEEKNGQTTVQGNDEHERKLYRPLTPDEKFERSVRRVLGYAQHPLLLDRMDTLLSDEDIDRMSGMDRCRLRVILIALPIAMKTDICFRNIVSLCNCLGYGVSKYVEDYMADPMNKEMHSGWTAYPFYLNKKQSRRLSEEKNTKANKLERSPGSRKRKQPSEPTPPLPPSESNPTNDSSSPPVKRPHSPLNGSPSSPSLSGDATASKPVTQVGSSELGSLVVNSDSPPGEESPGSRQSAGPTSPRSIDEMIARSLSIALDAHVYRDGKTALLIGRFTHNLISHEELEAMPRFTRTKLIYLLDSVPPELRTPEIYRNAISLYNSLGLQLSKRLDSYMRGRARNDTWRPYPYQRQEKKKYEKKKTEEEREKTDQKKADEEKEDAQSGQDQPAASAPSPPDTTFVYSVDPVPTHSPSIPPLSSSVSPTIRESPSFLTSSSVVPSLEDHQELPLPASPGGLDAK